MRRRLQLSPPARVSGLDFRISGSAFRRLGFGRTNPGKPMSAKWPVGSRIAEKCEKQTQPRYHPCYQSLTWIFGQISVKFGSTALLSGVGEGSRGRNLGANPNRAIEVKHSAINKMKPEWTEQTHGRHPSFYEQVTANFA
jgi:hypothetical protein